MNYKSLVTYKDFLKKMNSYKRSYSKLINREIKSSFVNEESFSLYDFFLEPRFENLFEVFKKT